MIRKIAALTLLLILAAVLPVYAWTVEDCEEVNYDHPDCDQYPTTTLPDVTTTTPNETTTTVEVQETTTTTGAPCPEGLIHQPPLCVSPSTTQPEVEVSSTVVSVTAEVLEELPHTGAPFFQLLAAASALLLLAGMAVLSFRRGNR